MAQQLLESFLGPLPTADAMNADASHDGSGLAFQSHSPLTSFLTFTSSFGDWAKLALLGAIVELARRTWSSIWGILLAAFFITAHFDGDDDAYDWMMIWLSKQDTWKKARELQVSTQNFSSMHRYEDTYDSVVVVDEAEAVSSRSRSLNFLPSFGSSSVMFYKRHYMRVSRNRERADQMMQETLEISIFGRDHAVLRGLLQEAHALYRAQEANRIGIYIVDNYYRWSWSGSRSKRPLSSIILDRGIKEMVLEDARDFMSSEAWYAARGIPYRRGYLLYGAPGAGKTSLIHALAGELDLDIYVLPLGKKGMDDTRLNEMICNIPARAIALLEDIDAAFTHGVTRENDEDKSKKDRGFDEGGISLSGLLGAIDGVAAQEGRLLFATTNRYDVLDEALIRPGRLDLHIEFRNASSWQAGEIFKCFYPYDENNDDDNVVKSNVPTADEKSRLINGQPTTVESKKSTPKLSKVERDALADAFAAGIPDGATSMASIQGHLMAFKTRPHEAAENAAAFIEAERKKQASREEKERQRTPKAKDSTD